MPTLETSLAVADSQNIINSVLLNVSKGHHARGRCDVGHGLVRLTFLMCMDDLLH